MAPTTIGRPSPLPQGTTLLHIGLPKTGTTAVQYACWSQKAHLAECGVAYPGTAFNHSRQVSALMGRKSGVWTAAPPLKEWQELVAEMRRVEAPRTLISYEQLTECDDEQAQRFVDELGPEVHIVITLRNFGSMLPSIWQQYVKNGVPRPLEDWLHKMLDDVEDRTITQSFWPRHGAVEQIERWSRIAGPERVTVVVLDAARPELLYDAFEGMLDLPQGTLSVSDPDGYRANRGLSALEVELVRSINEGIDRETHSPKSYNAIIGHGLIASLQKHRTPAKTEAKLTLPTWAAEWAAKYGQRVILALRESGVRVLGDETVLGTVVRSSTTVVVPETVPREVVVQAGLGLLAKSLYRSIDFAESEGPTRVGHPLRRVQRVKILREIRRRMLGRGGRVSS